MEQTSVLLQCQQIVREAGYEDTDVNVTNFLDYTDFVRDIIKSWPAKQRQGKKVLAFVKGLRQMRDNLAAIVEQDPMVLYKPAHKVALEFHASTAFIRYFRGGNRISKTQSAIAEIYWIVTKQHPFRQTSALPADIAIVSYSYTKYAPRVFEPKYVKGEGGNPLSPVFPEGGAWFNHYDSQRKIITVACPDCKKNGKPQACRHPKSTITLFSEREGPKAMPGAAYALVHMDEQVPYEFLPEALKRLETVPHSGAVVTETPLGGKGFWTHRVLTRDAKARKLIPGTKTPLVTLHTIDQFSAGLANHDKIRASMELMSPAEIEARVYGRPAAYSETGVFDHFELASMADDVKTPVRGVLLLEKEDKLPTAAVLAEYRSEDGVPEFVTEEDGPLRLWKAPEAHAQYVVGVDVAQGLIHGDASCASVLRMDIVDHQLYFTMVAQLHGWINPKNLAEDTFKLALWYNEAILVIERNGPGNETIRNLREWGYWNLFRDLADQAQADFCLESSFGISTDIKSKGTMVSMLQQQVKDRRKKTRHITIPCDDTLEEMGTFGQEVTDTGLNVRFRGESGMPDDRVMSLVVGVYAAITYGLYDFNLAATRRMLAAREHLTQEERETWDGFRRQLADGEQ